MPAPQKAPGKGELKRYLNAGMTQAQIVEAWERDSGIRVARATIAMQISNLGLKSARPRPRYEKMTPWHVKDEHKNHWDARMLRLEGRRRAKGEKALSAEELHWLEGWKANLAESKAVLFYNPDSDEGFAWVPRDEPDEPGMVTVDPNSDSSS